MSVTDFATMQQEMHAESLRKYYVAQQTCDILCAEYTEWRRKTMDATLSEISCYLPPIPADKYLKQQTTLAGHGSKVVDIDFGPDSNTIFSVCQDGFGIIWDVLSGLKLQAIPLIHQWVLSCSYSPSGRLVALAGLENKCTMYPVTYNEENSLSKGDGFELSKRLRGFRAQHKAYIGLLEFLSDSQLLTGLGDALIRLWDVEKLERVREFTEHSDEITHVLKSPDDIKSQADFISTSADGTVRLWDSRQQKSARSVQVSNHDIHALAQLPDGNGFVTGDELGLCQLYDFRSQCPLESYDIRDQFRTKNDATSFGFSAPPERNFPIPRAPLSPLSSKRSGDDYDIAGISSIALSKSGRIMYACYTDYGCISWDLFQKKIIEKVGFGSSAHQDRISKVKVSEDGQGLATASWDSTVKIWSI